MPSRTAHGESADASFAPPADSDAKLPGSVNTTNPVEGESTTVLHADRLRRFAFFRVESPDFIEDPRDRATLAWEQTLKSLANLAESEDWVGANPGDDRPLPILDSYLRYTYQRLVLEGKIAVSDDGSHAAINTGLLTPHAEDIFGLFVKNRVEDAQRWMFLRWTAESDRTILQHFPDPPTMAEYVRVAGDLVYDWRRPIKLAYEHILVDNLDRFPRDLASQPTRARQALDLAVAWATKRAMRNYKTVVPQWYPKLGAAGAQFLMPLDLTGDQSVDLALVISSVGDTVYRGHTVLTLDMAYTNARLVARPDSDWLLPQAVTLATHDDHDQVGAPDE